MKKSHQESATASAIRVLVVNYRTGWKSGYSDGVRAETSDT